MSVNGKDLSIDEFEEQFQAFLNSFNEQFDTPENQQAITQAAIDAFAEDPDGELGLDAHIEHIYQTERTNNLVKAAIAYFLDIH